MPPLLTIAEIGEDVLRLTQCGFGVGEVQRLFGHIQICETMIAAFAGGPYLLAREVVDLEMLRGFHRRGRK